MTGPFMKYIHFLFVIPTNKKKYLPFFVIQTCTRKLYSTLFHDAGGGGGNQKQAHKSPQNLNYFENKPAAQAADTDP